MLCDIRQQERAREGKQRVLRVSFGAPSVHRLRVTTARCPMRPSMVWLDRALLYEAENGIVPISVNPLPFPVPLVGYVSQNIRLDTLPMKTVHRLVEAYSQKKGTNFHLFDVAGAIPRKDSTARDARRMFLSSASLNNRK